MSTFHKKEKIVAIGEHTRRLLPKSLSVVQNDKACRLYATVYVVVDETIRRLFRSELKIKLSSDDCLLRRVSSYIITIMVIARTATA